MMTTMSARPRAARMTLTRSLLAVADDGFEGYGDAQLVEFLRQVEGVGVLAEGGEHLGADGDDFAFHKRSSVSCQFSVKSR